MSSNKVPAHWDAGRIQSLRGKVAIVTGGNSGVGFETALQLAHHDACVILACRNEARGNEAVHKIEGAIMNGSGSVIFMQLDVGSLASVKSFVDAFQARYDRLDLLINNAGIMAVPYATTPDGLESQFATNHLGHFALTAQLMHLLRASAPSRVVSLSSVAYRDASMEPSAIVTTKDAYDPMETYGKSKLCNLLFAFELDRRLRVGNITGVTSVACHPGITKTNILTTRKENLNVIKRTVIGLLISCTAQNVEMGALPSLYAATAPAVTGGDFYGPKNMLGMRGHPALEDPRENATCKETAAALWKESERLANLSFQL